MFKRIVCLLLTFLLVACAPTYNYRPDNTPETNFDRILVVLDYTQFVDDVGEVLDYNMTDNKQRADVLQADIRRVLSDKGYADHVEFAVLSSGLGFNPEWGFEHYQDNELMEELIYPPFYIQSPYPVAVQDELIESFMDAQRIAATSVSEDTHDYLNRVRLLPINLLAMQAAEQVDDETNHPVAVLHVRVLVPRISFVKAMGVSVISAGLTLGATSGAYIGVAVPMGRAHSTALLFDNNSGELVWKNFTLGDLTRQSDKGHDQFFKNFPIKP